MSTIRSILRLAALLVIAGLASFAVGAEPDAVTRWIERLGSDRYEERQEATQALNDLGPIAVDALQEAAKSPDLEVRNRANALIKQIQKRVRVGVLLEPKKVRINAQEKALTAVLDDLRLATGFNFKLDARHDLADRKVTLDTGEVTVWEALDQLFATANVVEAAPQPEQQYNSGVRTTSMMVLGGGNRTSPTDILKPDPPEKEEVFSLTEGKPREVPTQRSGAMRLKVLLPGTTLPGHSPQTGETIVALEVNLEPRLKWLQVLNVRVSRAVDDQDQLLPARFSFLGKAVNTSSGTTRMFINGQTIYTDESNPQGLAARLGPIRLQKAEKPSKSLKDLQGSLIGLVQSPAEELVRIDNLPQATGQHVAGKGGASLKVLETTAEEGLYQIRFHVVSPPRGAEDGSQAMSSAFVMINGRIISGYNDEPLSALNFTLADAQGRAFEIVRAVNSGKRAGLAREIELEIKLEEGRGEPARLTYTGRQTHVLEVPFVFKDVPLP